MSEKLKTNKSSNKLDKLVADSRQYQDKRARSYREQALKMYPWVCGRCSREFSRQNISELTVHHRDHNHDNNPEDGSNWELLCLYCHDNEHQRLIDATSVVNESRTHANATSQPFSDLKTLLNKK